MTSRRRLSVQAVRSRTTSPQSLLVLHCDAAKLRADQLHLGDLATVMAGFSTFAFGSNVLVEDVTTKEDLAAKFGRIAEMGTTFDVVVVVGHSNADGIRVASDLFMPWGGFARLLVPLKPRRLLLAACQAGRANVSEELFGGIRELRRVYACPVNASKGFGTMVIGMIPSIVSRRRPKDGHVKWSQVAAIALTGRQLREWRRSDKGNPDAVLLDHLADVADPLARATSRAVANIFRDHS